MDTAQYKDFQLALRRWLFSDSDDYGKVKRLTIKHILKDRIGGDVGSVKVEPDITTEDADGLIEEVQQICMADSKGTDEDQWYVIQPIFSDVSKAGSARFKLKVEAERDLLTIRDSEEATLGTVASQMMRHNENIMRLSVGQPGMLLQQAHRVIARQQDMIESMQEKFWEQANKRLEIYAMMEGMLSQRNERELAAKQSEQKMELTGEIGGKLLMLLPAIVNRMGGKKILPETTTPERMMMHEFMKTITKEQVEMMMKVFTPDQMMPILMMYQQYQQEEELKKAKESASGKSDETKE